jgi:hypothetical protein
VEQTGDDDFPGIAVARESGFYDAPMSDLQEQLDCMK